MVAGRGYVESNEEEKVECWSDYEECVRHFIASLVSLLSGRIRQSASLLSLLSSHESVGRMKTSIAVGGREMGYGSGGCFSSGCPRLDQQTQISLSERPPLTLSSSCQTNPPPPAQSRRF